MSEMPQPVQPPAPTFQPPPAQTFAQVCPHCATGMQPAQRNLTEKKRVKFGLFWILMSLISLGLAVVIWLVLPRKKVVTGVDRFWRCPSCKTEAPA